ncbi:hypothetical protein Tco_0843730 [Tanacetum coccineum]
MAEPTLEEFVEKAQIESYLSNTNDDMDIELRNEFLMSLQKNTYHRRFDEDVVDHIAKVLKILDLINIPGVDTHRLHNWGIDPLEFISRVNSSFENHRKVDGRTKKVLFHAWMNGSWNKRRIDDSILSSNDTTTDSFFKPYLKTREKNDIEREGERNPDEAQMHQ